MVNNEAWLAHSDLFKKYWIVETKPWVRSLGWFTDYMETVKDADGWAQAGEKELSVFDYVQIIDQPLAEKKLYRCVNGEWHGEDFYFQGKLRKAGYKILVDMNLSFQVRHVGQWAFGPSIGTNEEQRIKREVKKMENTKKVKKNGK